MKPIPLADSAAQEKRVGRKAAVLGQLLRRGLPVPDGVVLASEEFDGDLGTTRRRVRRAVARAAEELSSGFRLPLICRSSAVVEDSDRHSYAGLFLSRPNIWSLPALSRAVAEVRRAGRRVAGRGVAVEQEHRSPTEVSVLVQRMVRPAKSGVAFSHPGGGVCVEAVLGHAEALVQGLAAPRRYFVSRSGRVLAERTRTEGAVDRLFVTFVPPAQGWTMPPGARAELIPLTREDRSSARVLWVDRQRAAVWAVLEGDPGEVLGPGELEDVRALVLAAEDILDGPADVEWAIDEDGMLYVVQARPVTAELPTEHDAHPESQPSRPTVTVGVSRIVTGTTVSTGRAEGVVRHIDDPSSGEDPSILVALSTSPEDLPLLVRSAGVVVEELGLLSHTAILCREFGIPCVAGVPEARALLPPGTRVRLEATGREGRVEVLTSAETADGPGPTDRSDRETASTGAPQPAGEQLMTDATGSATPSSDGAALWARLGDLGLGRPVNLASVIAQALWRHDWERGGHPSPRDLAGAARRFAPSGPVLLWTSFQSFRPTGAERPDSACPATNHQGAEAHAWLHDILHSPRGIVLLDGLLQAEPDFALTLVVRGTREARRLSEEVMAPVLPLVSADRFYLVTTSRTAAFLAEAYHMRVLRSQGDLWVLSIEGG
ncbi:MAG TPA: hypothetical protein DHW14_04250 [Clostridiales bacterium]|nr:hypothetical protein [Clostridiales bacterium]